MLQQQANDNDNCNVYWFDKPLAELKGYSGVMSLKAWVRNAQTMSRLHATSSRTEEINQSNMYK